MENNYEPFNIEKAKAGAKLVTRYGLPARLICTDLIGNYPICCAITMPYGMEVPHSFTNKGIYNSTIEKSPFDLFILE